MNENYDFERSFPVQKYKACHKNSSRMPHQISRSSLLYEVRAANAARLFTVASVKFESDAEFVFVSHSRMHRKAESST